MASRFERAFAAMRQAHRTGLVAYLVAGDPDLARMPSLLRAIDGAGADVLEIGVPFSDPVADGPVIERAVERARRRGATLRTTLDMVERVRASIEAPIVIFTYANPVLRMGEAAFAARAAEVGVDGVLVVDLPIEESEALRDCLAREGLDMIFLIGPTSTDARIARAAELGAGFLYAISRLGVTGVRDEVPDAAGELVARIRRRSSLPIALGFGISRADHVVRAGAWADAAVVGSALVQIVAEADGAPDLEERAAGFVRELVEAGRCV